MKSLVLLSVSALIPFILAAAAGSRNKEPQITCLSEFDYDYKTLKKIVELEHAQEMLKNTIKAQQQMLQDIIQKVASLGKRSLSLSLCLSLSRHCASICYTFYLLAGEPKKIATFSE